MIDTMKITNIATNRADSRGDTDEEEEEVADAANRGATDRIFLFIYELFLNFDDNK